MKQLLLLCCVALFAVDGWAADAPPGRATGGRAHALPDWFKQSFLNIREDVEEARQAGKHLLIFMDLNDCPYCARTLDENFHGGDNMAYIQKHFDVVALNVRGDQEVTWIDGTHSTEQQLAAKLKIMGTPTLVFIGMDGKQALKLMGYRTPPTLRHALEFVHTRAYQQQSLADYIEKVQKTPVYTFRNHPRFENVTDFSGYKKPLAVIFEDRNCADCAGFHDKVLNHPDVMAELKPFRLVRLDAYAETPIVTFDGKRSTPRAWAASLGLNHRPGIVLFDEGREAARMEGRFYHFHFKEALRFVSGKHYQRYKRFGDYLNDRQPALLQQGINIDFSE